MDQSILFIIIGASSLVGGLIVGKLVFAKNTKKQVEEAEAQAANILKEAELYLINKNDLFRIYVENRNIESFGRIMAEQIAVRTIDIAMSLSSEKPEERVRKLIEQRPELFQQVPQKYLANLLGISPESLSRIRARRKS
jgi:CRP-like cAMP-binding protein